MTALEELRTATASTRRKLGKVLVSLQEAALRDDSDETLLNVAESIAEVSGALFGIERSAVDLKDAATRLVQVRDSLRQALGSLQSQRVQEAQLDEWLEGVADALASVLAELRRLEQATVQKIPAVSHAARAEHDEVVPLRPRKGLIVVGGTSDPPAAAPVPQQLPPAPSRRGNERVQLEVEVGFASESNFYTGLTMDLSAGGLFVATYQLLPVGTQVTMNFELPGGYRMSAAGVVRWVRESRNNDLMPGMGVAFAGLKPRELEVISRFCANRPPLYYDTD